MFHFASRIESLLVATLLAVLCLVGCEVTGQEPDSDAGEFVHIEGLGRLSFPNSGNEGARAPFLRGVLLLHSFEYELAAEAFVEAQQTDPEFALAYWGKL